MNYIVREGNNIFVKMPQYKGHADVQHILLNI
jgi:hypothetical protein